jgi:hypothetical protein
MDSILIAAAIVLALIVLDVLAVTHGVDSRDWIHDDAR